MAASARALDEDGFQIVARKSKKNSKQSSKTKLSNIEKEQIDQPIESRQNTVDSLTVERRIACAKDELLLSSFFETFKLTLRTSAVRPNLSHDLQLHTDESQPSRLTAGSVTDTTSEGGSVTDTTSENKDQTGNLHCQLQRNIVSDHQELKSTGHEGVAGTIQCVVCYGLGNFSSCVTARYQLAFLILLIDLLKVPSKRCHVYDPMFTSQEQEILAKFGFDVISLNEEGKRSISEPTLFYMPHCGKPLYNNLLWANWGMQLNQLVIMGNSFSNIYERLPSRQLSEIAPYILKVQPLTKEFRIKNNFPFQDIFNDLAVHTFPRELLQQASTWMWEDHAEPNYKDQDDAEIIFNQQLSHRKSNTFEVAGNNS